jgi:electron transport complex protein RnfD
MMLDVLIGLLPVLAVAVWIFQWYAIRQLVLCVGACVATEAVFTAIRRKPILIGDLSAVVTGVILALSLPGTAPWFVPIIGGVVAVGIGKVVFGGLGNNIFNPAMVGRAFVMIAFAGLLGATAYQAKTLPEGQEASALQQWLGVPVQTAQTDLPDAMTGATPMITWKDNHAAGGYEYPSMSRLLLGNINGSLGETGALACLLGGIYLCLRRTASWEIPLGVILGVAGWAAVANIGSATFLDEIGFHVLGGAVLFGAFFIATDPVSSPLTPKGKFIFGLGIGLTVMLLRTFSAYPEGVMFAVLLMNGIVPLLNRWTIPKPFGGPVPAPVGK